MSCNGCRVLRKGCSENCVLRSCLHWIGSSEAQANATLFLAKFFGRSDLMSLISAVPEPQRPALFQSLLFEACGRTVNPVNGAVGLLWSGNWQVCQAAVETVLSGGTIQPSPGITVAGASAHDDFPAEEAQPKYWSQSMPNQSQVSDLLRLSPAPNLAARSRDGRGKAGRDRDAMSFYSEESAVTTSRSFGAGHGGNEKKLLNLFV